jgi:uncharacterized protein YutE (UPF0331/DUF86 family)
MNEINETWSEHFSFCAASKNEEDRDWQARFISEVEKESPRGAVLTIVSFIDELLISLLLSYFPNKGHASKLIENYEGCLGTITHRADIAFSLSLLREEECKAIKLLSRIRNQFAHNWDGMDFNNKKVSFSINSFRGKYFANGSNRAKFNCAASNIIQQLLDRREYAVALHNKLPKVYKDIFDLTDEEREIYFKRGKNT